MPTTTHKPHGMQPGYLRLMVGNYRGVQYTLAVRNGALVCYIGDALHVPIRGPHDYCLWQDAETGTVYPDHGFSNHVDRIADRRLAAMGS